MQNANLTILSKRVLVILIVAGVIVTCLLFIFGLGGGRNNKPTSSNIIPTGPATSNDFKITNQDREQMNKQYLVSSLMNKLPYKGVDFSFDFNYDTGNFILVLNKNAVNQGYAEFNTFLKQNGVQSSWISNLNTYTQ